MKDYHNEDKADCTRDDCAKRLKCLRWHLGTNKDHYQTHVRVKDVENCKFFINLNDLK